MAGRIAHALFLILVVVACKSKSAPAVAKRVVSLSPSTTEALWVIGAQGALVGRSRYCDYPPEVRALPQVGGYVDPNLEAILALRPDLVVGARGPAGSSITERLESQGVATYFPETESFAQIDEMILGVGARTAHPERARAVVDEMHAREQAIESAVASAPRVRVLLVFGLAPIVVAGPKGFADEMLRRAGASNVVLEGTYPTIGLERVLALDPDVVVDAAIAEAHGGERIARDTPGWSAVRAVKEGHVVSIDDESVLRPGPRLPDGLRVLARALHPGVSVP